MAVAIGLGLRWAGSGPSSLLTGFVSGILATSTAINGPPIVLYLQATSLGPAAFRAAMSNLLVLNGIFSTTGFVVAGVDAVVADVAGGEDHDLAGVARVGQDFLIPGHAGVEDNLAPGGQGRAEQLPGQDESVLQCDKGFHHSIPGLGLPVAFRPEVTRGWITASSMCSRPIRCCSSEARPSPNPARGSGLAANSSR